MFLSYYSWPCLYLWMRQHAECPVCKAGISDDNVIPVYGRGVDAVDPRDQPLSAQDDSASETQIPDRPRGQRLDPELMRRRRPRHVRC
jgi:E3 ubiquitin-protein ligase RNF5